MISYNKVLEVFASILSVNNALSLKIEASFKPNLAISHLFSFLNMRFNQ